MKVNTKLLVLTGMLLGAIFMGAQWLAQSHSPLSEQDLVNASLYPEPKPINAFHLVNNLGKPFTEKELIGHWTMVFFGFTNCPSMCPTAMAVLNQMYGKLRNVPLPVIVFISVDPKRDNLKKLGQYVQGFNPHFIGVTGSKAEIDGLTRQMSVLYIKIKPEAGSAGEYNIDHSGSILLINPQGQLHAVFSMPHDADKMVKDYTTIIEHG